MTLRIPILPQDAAAALAARGGGPDAATYLYANFTRYGQHEAADYIANNGFALPARAPAAPAIDGAAYAAPPPGESPESNEGDTGEDAPPILLAENTVGKNTRTDVGGASPIKNENNMKLRETEVLGEDQGSVAGPESNTQISKTPADSNDRLDLKLSPDLGGEKLKLGVNERYRTAIEEASRRTGIPPSSIAAVINVEAAKLANRDLKAVLESEVAKQLLGPNKAPTAAELEELKKTPQWKIASRELSGLWYAESHNPHGAHGLTQFKGSTWIEQATTLGTYLNEQAKKLGLVDKNNKMVAGKQDELLTLRGDPTLSIIAAAEYDKGKFDEIARLRKVDGTPYVPSSLTPDQKAYYLYIAHHEGAGGGASFLKGKYSNEGLLDASISQNIDSKTFARLLEENSGDKSKAYISWLNNFVSNNVVPSRFREAKK